MNRIITLILSTIMILLVLGSAVGLWSYKQKKYNEESKALQSQIDEKQIELNSLKKEVDANGYRPADVVTNFFDEMKSDDILSASLYLAGNYNIATASKAFNFNFKTDNPTLQETNVSISDDNATVNASFKTNGDSDYKMRLFYLVKEDNVWKISRIKEISGV